MSTDAVRKTPGFLRPRAATQEEENRRRQWAEVLMAMRLEPAGRYVSCFGALVRSTADSTEEAAEYEAGKELDT